MTTAMPTANPTTAPDPDPAASWGVAVGGSVTASHFGQRRSTDSGAQSDRGDHGRRERVLGDAQTVEGEEMSESEMGK